MAPISKHRLKIAAEIFGAGCFGWNVYEIAVIINVPPVAFSGTLT